MLSGHVLRPPPLPLSGRSEKTNSFPVAAEMSQRHVGRGKRGGAEGGTGRPAVVNDSSSYPAPQTIGQTASSVESIGAAKGGREGGASH